MTREGRRGRVAASILASLAVWLVLVGVSVALSGAHGDSSVLGVDGAASKRGVERQGATGLPGMAPLADQSWVVSVPLVLGGTCVGGGELPLGISLQTEQNRVPDLVSQLGARWARTSVWWRNLEPDNATPDDYQWASTDTNLATVTGLGLTPIVLVLSNPSWASTTACGPIDLVGMEEFAEFVGALAERYDGDADYDGDGLDDGPAMPNVTHWEFYNEPDCHDLQVGEWLGGCWGSYGSEYAQMLSVAWSAMHAANDQTVILFGGMAAEPMPEWFNFNMAGGDFLDDVLGYMRSHPGDYFDWLAFHHYHAFNQRWAPYGQGIMGKAAYLRGRLQEFGLVKPVACTEVGLRSDKEYDGIPFGSEGQSRYLVRSLVRGASGGLKAITWYKMRDDAEEKWGLLDTSYAKNPSYQAFQTLARELGSSRSRGEVSLGQGVEAHEFEALDCTVTTVLWSLSEDSVVVRFEAPSLRVVDKYGVVTDISDGGPGDADVSVNGEVSLAVDGSSVYVSAED